ncbi:hypothetical protein EEB11_05965 [Pseudotabrizicola sediminis]|uniref:Excalibur calcium-binding domain-containing protein n=1 Tax=Pseudotabrizicola sediminis TaxID=2486418 RepID=A0ABY2KNK3_9RHOB|nr:hypothetical protein [Pseudotabrizicola sediminis]TGD44233.1 hypothetical protein EEB11_05965 [Pseudotabrizicola sediminis]TGD64678.1 hypothetical protein EYC08_10410 [Tabrizicola sp. WMC-M-20]
MRVSLLLLLPLTLAACASAVPDSGAGVGFQDYNSYVRDRDAAAGRPQPVVTPGFSTDQIGAAIDRADGRGGIVPSGGSSTGAVIGAPIVSGEIRPRGNAPAGIREETGEAARIASLGGGATISDENDFDAVASRETIESDRARIDRNRAQYQVIQPGALPVRSGAAGPNIVDYALATSHPRGTQLYRRSGFGVGNTAAKCAGYASPDLAQQAFLERGGPERDRLGLDPDGDGYACTWDPSPYRLR